MTIEAVKMCVDSIVLVPASFLDSLYCSHFRLQQTVLNVSYRKGPSQMKKGTPIFLLSGIKRNANILLLFRRQQCISKPCMWWISHYFFSLLAALPLVAIQTLQICVCVLLTLFSPKLHNRREKFLTTYYFSKTFYGGKTLLCWEAILHPIPPLLILRFGEWTLSYMLSFFSP